MIKTRITELFGIKYPIVGGTMVRLSWAPLVSAISNAGGLGVLSSAFPSPKELREEIKKTKDMTDKPFGVNFGLFPSFQPVDTKAFIAAAIEEGVKIFETTGRIPEDYVKIIKDAKLTWYHRCARTRDCRTAERLGADACAIIGYEGAGLVGMTEDVTSMIRIPATVEAVKIPVMAAGGIGDARGFVAALALGAEGVVMGTRFMASKECVMHPNVKEKMLQTAENELIFVNASIGSRERVINTPFAQRILKMEEQGATLQELQPLITGERQWHAYRDGEVEDAPIHCGQVVGLIHEILSVKEIIERIISEAEVIQQRLRKMGVFK